MNENAPSRQRVLIASILAVSMTMIDQTIVAISSPVIQDKLGISHGALQWAINAYILATAASFALGGKLADNIGHRTMALVGTGGFAVASLLCSVSPHGSIGAIWLIASRVLQGIFGGFMFPAALGLVIAGLDKARRGTSMAIFFAVTGAMTAVGPIAGGYLVAISWRAIFWINIPIAIVSMIVMATVPAPERRARRPIDWRGAGVIAVGMTLLILGIQQANSWSLTAAVVVAAIGAAVLVAAVLLELRTQNPLVEVRRFASRGFTASSLAITFASFAFVPLFFFLSVYAQVSLGEDAGTTGLEIFKFFIGFVIASQVGSRLFDARGARLPIIIGGVIGAVGFGWWAAGLTDISHPNTFVNPQLWPTLLAGFGIGFMLSATSTDGVNRGDEASYGEITGIFQTMRNFGAALGIALLTAVVSSRLVSVLTTKITALGAPSDVAGRTAHQVSDAISGSSDAVASGGAAPTPAELLLVQNSYAAAVQAAYFMMAGAMLIVALIGVFLHPGDRTSTMDDPSIVPGVPADSAS